MNRCPSSTGQLDLYGEPLQGWAVAFSDTLENYVFFNQGVWASFTVSSGVVNSYGAVASEWRDSIVFSELGILDQTHVDAFDCRSVWLGRLEGSEDSILGLSKAFGLFGGTTAHLLQIQLLPGSAAKAMFPVNHEQD